MRTTIRLDDELLFQLKLVIARSHKTLTGLIEEALREKLVRQQETVVRSPLKLETVSGKGLQPGVDLDDSATLLSLMEESNDPA
jgi:hypothetical protein